MNPLISAANQIARLTAALALILVSLWILAGLLFLFLWSYAHLAEFRRILECAT